MQTTDEQASDENRARNENRAFPGSARAIAVRLTAVAVALVPVILMFIALNLVPDDRGLGTHQQLGLPPCTMRVLLAIRCPACGMTTSWAHFVRGQWLASAKVNLGGFLLAIYSLWAVVLLLMSGRRGNWPSQPTQTVACVLLVAIMVISLGDWGVRLFMERYL